MSQGNDNTGPFANQIPLSIGQVAQHAGRSASSIRYYESIGVLPQPQRVGGQRRYAPEVLGLLAVIDAAQRQTTRRWLRAASTCQCLTLEDCPSWIPAPRGSAHDRAFTRLVDFSC